MSPILTVAFWDCECEKNYIHRRTVKTCITCNTVEEDGPDSHLSEVIEAGLLEAVRRCGESVNVEDSDDCPDLKHHDEIEELI